MSAREARVYNGVTVQLYDLANELGVITDVLVERCTILGPAVLAWDNIHISNCAWATDDMRALLWPVSRDRTTVVGALHLRDAAIMDSTFKGVGIAIHEDAIEDFLRNHVTYPQP